MPDIKVTKEGVVKLLLKLNPSKASGPDLLPARVLKELAIQIAPFLTIIFQESFNVGGSSEGLEDGKHDSNFQKG